MPAALRSVAALARAGVYTHKQNWGELADKYAKVWEDQTLGFFEVSQNFLLAIQILTVPD